MALTEVSWPLFYTAGSGVPECSTAYACPHPGALQVAIVKAAARPCRADSDDWLGLASTAAPSPELGAAPSPVWPVADSADSSPCWSYAPPAASSWCGSSGSWHGGAGGGHSSDSLLLPDVPPFELPQAVSFELSVLEVHDSGAKEPVFRELPPFELPETASFQDVCDSDDLAEQYEDCRTLEEEVAAVLDLLAELVARRRCTAQRGRSDQEPTAVPVQQATPWIAETTGVCVASWQVPPGQAATGAWASAAAPRPKPHLLPPAGVSCVDPMTTWSAQDPLSIRLDDASGARLEVAAGWPAELWDQAEQATLRRTKAAAAAARSRRRQGRSRSPAPFALEGEDRGPFCDPRLRGRRL